MAREIAYRIAGPMKFLKTLILPLTIFIASCGGGSHAGPPAPSQLSYSSAPAFVINRQITPLQPSVMGMVSNFSVAPSLPAGLGISAATGIISGTPTIVAAKTTYTVTATGSSGSTTAQVSLVVNDVPPSISYPSSYYSFTKGVAANSIAPASSGGAAVNWSITPDLPGGLALNAKDGTVSGTATASSVATTYTITATNSGGQSTAHITIAVAASPVLDLGHATAVDEVRISGSHAFSQDVSGHWVLWDYSTSANLGNGTSIPCQSSYCSASLPSDLAGPTLVIGTMSGFDIRASSDGHLVSGVSGTFPWWKLATDGSYICAGSTNGLQVWSASGELLFTRAGDYSSAAAFAAPGHVLIALGPAGANSVETISVPAGTSSLGAPFLGTFKSWFIDGSSFFTNDINANRIRVYSSASLAEDAVVPNGSLSNNVVGQGTWFWTYAGQLSVYKVGASATPTSTFSFTKTPSLVLPSGSTVGIFGAQYASVIDLSGSVPTQTDYQNFSIYGGPAAYAASSSAQWIVADGYGVVLDGGTGSSATPRYFGYGKPLDIAGGESYFALATATGSILYFDTATNSLQGSVGFFGSKIQLSADGKVLAAKSAGLPASQQTSVNIYSLPAGTLVSTLQYGPVTQSILLDFTLASSGAFVGIETSIGPTGGLQVYAVSSVSTPAWTTPGPRARSDGPWRPLLSPDGTLAAISSLPVGFGVTATTDIYKSGTLSASHDSATALGWIDNGRVLIANYDFTGAIGRYLGTGVYDPTAALLASTTLPPLALFQVVTPQQTNPDLIYSPELNRIYSISSGAETWTSASPYVGLNTGPPASVDGVVAGQQIVFISGNLLLAESH